MKQTDYQTLIERAQAGDRGATERLLEACRVRLKDIATAAFDERLGPEWDPSDAVQESLMEAHRDLPTFRGRQVEALYAWLRSILEHNLADRVKYLSRQKRQSEPRRSLEEADHHGLDLRHVIAADQSSVSARVMSQERQQHLARAIDELPEHQARVVRLRHLSGLSLDQIAKKVGRSRPAVAGLLVRATRALNNRLSSDHGGRSVGSASNNGSG
ncbi:MAG: sigma-70 family RNA polymerase sigma factor [Fuerstiella sp.]